MNNNLVRRLEVKSAIIEQSNLRVQTDLRAARSVLQASQTKVQTVEKSWKQTMQQLTQGLMKGAGIEQRFYLQADLMQLRQAGKQLNTAKLQKISAQETLASKASDYQTNLKQIEFLNAKKQELVRQAAELSEQGQLDELAVQRLLSPVNKDQNSLSALDDSLSNTSINLNVETNQLTQLPPPALISDIPVRTTTENNLAQLVSSEIGKTQIRIQTIEQNQSLLQQANQAVHWAIVDGPSGTSFALDYLLEPGKMVSLDAFQGDSQKRPEVELSFSDYQQRQAVLANQDELEKSSVAKISIRKS